MKVFILKVNLIRNVHEIFYIVSVCVLCKFDYFKYICKLNCLICTIDDIFGFVNWGDRVSSNIFKFLVHFLSLSHLNQY